MSQINEYKPQDATTNPSLILAAAQLPENEDLVNSIIKQSLRGQILSKTSLLEISDRLTVEFGTKILSIVPGYVSTEVDPRLSFNTEKTIKRAERLIELYKEKNVDTSRVLIKIASTWEGIKAAKVLQSQLIQCNLTLVFNIYQAVACAEAGATLISPFVGRILDWHKKNTGKSYNGADDPGVRSVSEIFQYFKKQEYKTIVMGASFRSAGEIIHLAGCDRLTIAPSLLKVLDGMDAKITTNINDLTFKHKKIPTLDQKKVRWFLNQDAMAT